MYAEHLVDDQMDEFFSALERVQQVRDDCKELVAKGDVKCRWGLSRLVVLLCVGII